MNIEEVKKFGRNVDFGATATDYSKFRSGFPDEFFDLLKEKNLFFDNSFVIDIGTGTGTIARGIAEKGARVIGIDPSEKLLTQARQTFSPCKDRIEYVRGVAESIQFDSSIFDMAIAGQCWHWFARGKAATEIRRILKPNGVLVIAHFDWVPLPDNVVHYTEKLIKEFNPDWELGDGAGIYPAWFKDVAVAGFNEIESHSFDMQIAYSHYRWRRRIQASAGVKASLDKKAAKNFDRELKGLLDAKFSNDPLSIPHRCWMLICKKPCI